MSISLEQAQAQRRCRICGETLCEDNDAFPKGWQHEFAEMVYPVHVIINFGKECAHARCLDTDRKLASATLNPPRKRE